MPNIIIYGNYEESSTSISFADLSPMHIFRHTDVYDTFLSYLAEYAPQAIFILTDGAAGMEGVIAVKNLYPQCPVARISNDKGFGIQSYRLGCAFFAEKPLTKKKIAIAFERIAKAHCDDMPEDVSAGIDINRFKLFFDSLH